MTIKLNASIPQKDERNSLLALDEQDLVDDPRDLIAVVRLKPLSAKQMLDGSKADEIVLAVTAIEHLGGPWGDQAAQIMLEARGQRTGQQLLKPNEYTEDDIAGAVAALLQGVEEPSCPTCGAAPDECAHIGAPESDDELEAVAS